ncbi:hypothetical protein Tco_0801067 [Tanacetum coccineum]|uniref:Uncharacterized protein n=1 Tax=Tanacetum coccineum TaxID=301880 RepID=A0ABQ4ZUY8_9ASTR
MCFVLSAYFSYGKDGPFLSPGTSISAKRTIDGANAYHQTKGPELDGLLGVVLEQFKPSKENEKINVIDLDDEIHITHLTEESQTQDSSKRRNTFGGLYGKPPAPKRLVILGDDPKPRQVNYNRPFITKEKPLPLYNHYDGGSGWWDSDMEGIDNEAVGSNEVWEGVGSATMGGLD